MSERIGGWCMPWYTYDIHHTVFKIWSDAVISLFLYYTNTYLPPGTLAGTCTRPYTDGNTLFERHNVAAVVGAASFAPLQRAPSFSWVSYSGSHKLPPPRKSISQHHLQSIQWADRRARGWSPSHHLHFFQSPKSSRFTKSRVTPTPFNQYGAFHTRVRADPTLVVCVIWHIRTVHPRCQLELNFIAPFNRFTHAQCTWFCALLSVTCRLHKSKLFQMTSNPTAINTVQSSTSAIGIFEFLTKGLVPFLITYQIQLDCNQNQSTLSNCQGREIE